MRAIVSKKGRPVFASNLPSPTLQAGEVLVQVGHAAICRTDLYVADGRISVDEGRILGHEFGGIVVEATEGTDPNLVGQRVVVDPTLPCGRCDHCLAQSPHLCGELGLLGVNLDGAFAEFTAVAESRVRLCPQEISPLLSTYVEPAAAALAILEIGLSHDERVLILGDGRIVDLCHLVLETAGFQRIQIGQPESGVSYDTIVECGLKSDELIRLIPHLRPGGCIVLKSRTPETINFSPWPLVKRRIKIVPAHYASFDKALSFVADHTGTLKTYLGQSYPLEDFASAFSNASQSEAKKLTFLIKD